MRGGAIHLRSGTSSRLTISNCILWGDEPTEIYRDYGTSANVTYCDIEGEWSGTGNIDCDPEFCVPDTANLYLSDSSCCLGAAQGGSDIGAFGVGCPSVFICGDSDWSGETDLDDVVYLVNYIFCGGLQPVPYEAGDIDCSDIIDVDDVVYLISFVFCGGSAPCDTDGDGVPDC